jgi:hypothetical protein
VQAGRRRFPPGFLLGLAITAAVVPTVRSHDIPNQRVNRSIQVTVGPGRLEIADEVSLSELTLTQDLRALTGSLPGGYRSAWLALYGETTGPLNANGFAMTGTANPDFRTAGRHVRALVDERVWLRWRVVMAKVAWDCLRHDAVGDWGLSFRARVNGDSLIA